jgi:RNA polymerase sigma-70 factor (ECF subfamily)
MATAATLSPTIATDNDPTARSRIEHHLVTERKAMLGLALQLTHNQAEADELVQATSLRCLLRPHRLRHQDNVPAWVGRVMSRLFIDGWRQRGRRARWLDEQRVEAENVLAVEPATEMDDCPWEWVTVADVRAAVRGLTPIQREAFELFTFHRLSYEEIAMRLRIPLRTVGTRLQRARCRLRSLLAASVQAGGRVTPLWPLRAVGQDEGSPADQRRCAVG